MAEEIAAFMQMIGLIIGLGISVPILVQYIHGISGRMSTARNLEIQSSSNTSANMSVSQTNATEEVSKTANKQ